jgi:2',3'-cyclic-nucleotide 2'-phosphodiesterase/3'-nucleotidase
MTMTGKLVSRSVLGAGKGGILRLRVLATTDLHAHLFPFNYYADCRDDSVGLAGLATLIEQARAECPNTLLFDNGDTLQGAPLGDAAMSELLPCGDVHPMIAAMNGLRYDAATLGNHDFDFGLEVLERTLAAARYPVVLANARRLAAGRGIVAQHAMLERNLVDEAGAVRTLRIGVTGATPPQVMRWARAHLEGRLQVDAILPAVRREVAVLREKGADLVIVLAHSGLGPELNTDDGENVGRLLARLDGVDAVVAGHTHGVFPRPDDPAGLVAGTPLVQPGFWGSHLDQIDLELRATPGTDPAARPVWAVQGVNVKLRALAEANVADAAALRRRLDHLPAFRRQMVRGHRLTRAYSSRPLGRSAVPLETYFSLLAPCAATQVIADAQRAAVARVVAEREDLADLPLISVTTPFKAGGRAGPGNYTDVPAGTLLLRHAADLYSYSNGLSLLRATGTQIRDWLERSASAFHRIDPGADGAPQPLIDMAFASYNFDRMDGLSYEIDLSQAAHTNAEGDEIRDGPGRIRNLRLSCGLPVRDEGRYLLICSSYRAAGGGHFPAAADCEQVYSTPDPVRNALVNYITRASGPLDPVIEPSFSFTPLGGTPVLVHTGPSAAAHADRIKALGLVPDGIEDSGFARYLLRI